MTDQTKPAAPVLAAAGVMQPVDERALFMDWAQQTYETRLGKDWRCVTFNVNHGDKAFAAFRGGMQAARAALSAGPTQAAALLTCAKCGANRMKEPCGNMQDCGVIGTAQAAEQTATTASAGGANVDWLGLALDLESQAKRVESQTVERAMRAAANGLRLMGDSRAQAPSQDAPAAQVDEPVAEFIEDATTPGGARFKLLKPLEVGAKLYTAPTSHTQAGSVARVGKSLLRPAISASNPLPPGCHCKSGQCAAPRIMGRQTPCRDPLKRDAVPAAQAVERAAPDAVPPMLTMKEAFEAVGGWYSGGDLGYPSFGSANALWAYTDKMQRNAVARALAATPAGTEPTQAARDVLADDAWKMVCGDWRDELVAVHNAKGHIASGLSIEQARALIDAHSSGNSGIAAMSAEIERIDRASAKGEQECD